MKQLVPILVARATSEDDDHPAIQLQSHAHTAHGWQSSKLCEYPQEIVFMVNHGSPVRVATRPVAPADRHSQCQVLAHQTKIPSRIDVYLRATPRAAFELLGYVGLDSNTTSQYSARELKTIAIDRDVAYLKLVMHSCHRNRFNVFDQVGLVAVALYTAEAPAMQLAPVQPPWSQQSSRDDAHWDLFSVPHPAQRGVRLSLRKVLESLRVQRQHSVDAQDYATAKRLQGHENQCLAWAMQLTQLQAQKTAVVQREDFDAATLLKHEMDALLGDLATLAATIYEPAPELSSPKRPLPLPAVQRLKPPIDSASRPLSAIERVHVPEPLPPALLAVATNAASEPLLAVCSLAVLEQAFSEHAHLRVPGVERLVALLRSMAPDAVPARVYLPWLYAAVLETPLHVLSTATTMLVLLVGRFRDMAAFLDDMPSVLAVLVERLGDASAAVRNKVAGTLLEPTHITGAVIVAALKDYAQRHMEPCSTPWRVMYGLLRVGFYRHVVLSAAQVATTLLGEYQCLTARDLEVILPFLHAHNAFHHPVRQIGDAMDHFAIALVHDGGSDHLAAVVDADQLARYERLAHEEWA
ncbi:hypothetical protein ACHHYP_02098 [Achlya hypogyna]|uniref:Centrosomal protein CEP104 N-terminal domain-containing protein n=1 Tax=Achlya hypogyna TaxID=1202772 RepID=A0A1V9Z7D2_ACHHY|nr:hypothetical protein ACHHYP_02098 [Achlya hypogyna]